MMSDSTAGTDVAVVGGGVIGLSVAWRAASAGMTVTVFDPLDDSGASHVGAGMLAPVTEASYGEEALLDLSIESARRYPEFAAELEQAADRPSGYRRCGTLQVALDRDENVALDELFSYQQHVGLDVQRLRGRQCREFEPALAPNVRGGILAVEDHQVDNRALLGALRAACERAGVRVRRGEVTGLAVSGERATGVKLASGRLDADQVVLAAGCWSGGLEGLPPGTVPVRPVKGQLLRLRARSRHDVTVATRVLRSAEVYIVPRGDGRLVVGGTVEEQGFDVTVTAGAVYELLRAAYELLPGISEFELVEASAGLRPGSPDNAPLLGAGPLDGLVVATGHYRNGLLLAPVTADGIGALLVDGKLPELLEPFSPTRFERA